MALNSIIRLQLRVFRPGCEEAASSSCGSQQQGIDPKNCGTDKVSVFEKRVATGRSAEVKRPVEDLAYSNLTQTSVVLSWKVDPCANAYNLMRTTDSSKQNLSNRSNIMKRCIKTVFFISQFQATTRCWLADQSISRRGTEKT